MGWILTIIIGIIGAVIGGWCSANFGLGMAMTWVAAILAAIILLFIYEAIRSKTARPRV